MPFVLRSFVFEENVLLELNHKTYLMLPTFVSMYYFSVDNEILEFCDVLRRRLVMESITPSTFPTDYQAGGNVALLGSAKRHLDPDHEVERDSKRSHNDVSFDRVRNCNDEDIIRNSHVSAGRGDMPTIVTSREIRRFLHSHNSDLQDTDLVND